MFPLDEGAYRGEKTFEYIYIYIYRITCGKRGISDSSGTDVYCGKGHRRFSRSLCCWVRNLERPLWIVDAFEIRDSHDDLECSIWKNPDIWLLCSKIPPLKREF